MPTDSTDYIENTFYRQQTLYRGGELDIPGEELGDAVLDLVLSNELRSAEVEALDLLGALRKVGPVQHGGLLGDTGAQLCRVQKGAEGFRD